MHGLPICDTAAIRALEQQAAGAPLMERAGAAAAGQARLLAPRTADRIVVFAGPGNNGGDAFVVARHLQGWGYQVSVVCNADPARLPPDARTAFARWQRAGAVLLAQPPVLGDCGLVIDGLFGIGLTRALTGDYADWIAAINRRDGPVLALDIPSGLDADTGTCIGVAVRATHTATFIALKPGLLTGDGLDHAGEVTLHDLEIDSRNGAPGCGSLIDWTVARRWLPERRRNSHKGSFGSLAVLGGSAGMTGAPLLAGRAALHAGAGKVTIALVHDAAATVDHAQLELMLRSADAVLRDEFSALVAGPGLGQSRSAFDYLARVISRPAPLVLDADALNLLALEPGLVQRLRNRTQPTILTPHPAEAGRLLQTSAAIVQSDRIAAAKTIAQRYNAAVALKGAGTICVSPAGEWSINGSGNPGLASAGTGDVLAGVIGALLAQGYDRDRALALGVFLHGAAADALVAGGTGPIGITASELAPEIRNLMNAKGAVSSARRVV